MISMTLSQAATVLNGALQGEDRKFDAVTTDTRKITAGCLFVALKGERFDAHDFAGQAKENGAGALLVNRQLDIDLPQIVVKDTRLAFGSLARCTSDWTCWMCWLVRRSSSKSCGVKEWLIIGWTSSDGLLSLSTTNAAWVPLLVSACQAIELK